MGLIHGDEDVVGLEVAMNKIMCVKCIKSCGDLRHDVERLIPWKCLVFSKVMAKRAAWDVFHDNAWGVIGQYTIINDVDNVGVLEARHDLSFLLKAFSVLAFGVGLQDLDGNFTFKRDLLRKVNLTHGASSKGVCDLVTVEDNLLI